MQLFSIPITSSNLHNQAPLFTELRLLQGIKLRRQCLFCHQDDSSKRLPRKETNL